MVTLIIKGQPVEFGELQAQNILQIQAGIEKSGVTLPEKYELPNDSPYEFVGNGLRLRESKKHSRKAAERKADAESDSAL